ncbi:tyrosine-type recombinase/integrase [Actinoallomurus iriomotensis]|uniref:tyrosine-type recombinase/integrase n=1 Tax=Actinoallomurus iriomotensis TaxID=478107 RepID=UPI003D7F22EA
MTLPEAGLHDLRHATASLLKRLGVPPSDAKEILGHTRISVTLEIYTHGDNAGHREGLGKPAVAVKSPHRISDGGFDHGGPRWT